MTTISKEKMKLILEELSLVITFANRASELLNHDRGNLKESALTADSYIDGIKSTTKRLKEILNDTGNES